jgi:RIO kinase 1
MYQYIRNDPRYFNLKRNRRSVIFSWCQREYRNLHKVRVAGVRVPTPYTYLHNILVMEFIGDDEVTPKLKDKVPKNLEKFFKETLKQIKRMYKSGFIHGDLSAFNILNHNNLPVLIDLSSTTPVDTPNSKELLERDVKNIVNFFNKQGLDLKREAIFNMITKK